MDTNEIITPVRQIYRANLHPGQPDTLVQQELVPTPKAANTSVNISVDSSNSNPFETPTQPHAPIPAPLLRPPSPPRRLVPSRSRRTTRLIADHIKYFRQPTCSTFDPEIIRGETQIERQFQSVTHIVDQEDIDRLNDQLHRSPRRRLIFAALSGNPIRTVHLRFLTFERPTGYYNTIHVVNATTCPLPPNVVRLDNYVAYIHEVHTIEDHRATIYPLRTEVENHLAEGDTPSSVACAAPSEPGSDSDHSEEGEDSETEA